MLVVGLAACGASKSATTSHSSGYDSSISRGLNAVAENKMATALTYFENALTQKPKDQKATAYKQQTQAYLDTQAELKAGEVKKAVTTVTAGVKIKHGAKSLATKLSDLKTTATKNLAEYNQLNKAVTAQLKVTDGNYDNDILKQCQAIDWQKKPYLSQLKTKVNQLIKQAKKSDSSSATTDSSSSSAASSSSATSSSQVSAADQKEAAQMRTNIVQSDPGSWDSAALAQVPDSVIVAATKKSNEMGGDPGTTANMIAKQYPNIKKQTSASETTGSSDATKQRADQIRTVLENSQDFSEAVLNDIPDNEVINAAKGGFSSNADIARTADTLLQSHPDLK